ncbi:MAG: L-ribulose-5-phosphate 4-epimerase AraD [Vicinamibacteria bacterium]|nr:L-ribulose-5-phosphate 4-epimerase AraD [Vicinamibacteria bacterium]
MNDLRMAVLDANLELVRRGLVHDTWGNASGIDRERGLIAIKPSGIAYEVMKPGDMTIVALDSGEAVEGDYRPSSDTPTHLALYRAFKTIGGVVHTHSLYATAWSQANRDLPALGTTHADQFHGAVPCTRKLRPSEIREDYEQNTGRVIVERFRKLDPMQIPAVLAASHGPFAWGATPAEAVVNADVLEHVARLASETLRIAPRAPSMQKALLDKHFFRKHGPSARYGQNRVKNERSPR